MKVIHHIHKILNASTEDVDLIVKRSIASGAEGARLTGGGFGGFTVSLISKNNYQDWKKNMMNSMIIKIYLKSNAKV